MFDQFLAGPGPRGWPTRARRIQDPQSSRRMSANGIQIKSVLYMYLLCSADPLTLCQVRRSLSLPRLSSLYGGNKHLGFFFLLLPYRMCARVPRGFTTSLAAESCISARGECSSPVALPALCFVPTLQFQFCRRRRRRRRILHTLPHFRTFAGRRLHILRRRTFHCLDGALS